MIEEGKCLSYDKEGKGCVNKMVEREKRGKNRGGKKQSKRGKNGIKE